MRLRRRSQERLHGLLKLRVFRWISILSHRQSTTMAEPISDSIDIMSYDKDRAKRPFNAPPIPDVFCGWIGKLAITWSLIELQLDQLIEALLKASQATRPDRWERRDFKKRKALCRDLAKTFFAGASSVISHLCEILDAAADLHQRRNIILHGKLSVTLTAMQDPGRVWIEATLSARSRRYDKTLVFNTSDVEDLFYEIGHVSGLLNQFMTVGDVPSSIASDDKSRLQDFLRDNLPSPPTMQKP